MEALLDSTSNAQRMHGAAGYVWEPSATRCRVRKRTRAEVAVIKLMRLSLHLCFLCPVLLQVSCDNCSDTPNRAQFAQGIVLNNVTTLESSVLFLYSLRDRGLLGVWPDADQATVFTRDGTAKTVHLQSFLQDSSGSWGNDEYGIRFSPSEWSRLAATVASLKALGIHSASAAGVSCSADGVSYHVQLHDTAGSISGSDVVIVWAPGGLLANCGRAVTGFSPSEWCSPKHKFDKRYIQVLDGWYVFAIWD